MTARKLGSKSMMIAQAAIWMLLTLFGAGNVFADTGTHWHDTAGSAANTPGVTTQDCTHMSAGDTCAYLVSGVEVSDPVQIDSGVTNCTLKQDAANTVEIQSGYGTDYSTPPGYTLTDADHSANIGGLAGVWQSFQISITTFNTGGLVYASCY